MNWLFLPWLAGPARCPCGMAREAWALFELIRDHPLQRRKQLTCDTRLVAAANYKARVVWEDHPQRGHTFRGVGANQNVKDFAYTLPYDGGESNQVESWVKRWSAEAALTAFLESEDHRTHLLALHPFYEDQRCGAVGFYRSVLHEPLQRPHVFVVLLCPPN